MRKTIPMLLAAGMLATAMGAAAQGVLIYKSDNTVLRYNHADIDSIVAFAAGEEVQTVDATEFENAYYATRSEAWFGRNFWEGMWLCTDEAVGVSFNGDWWDNGRLYYASVHDFQEYAPGSGLIWDLISGINTANEIIAKYSNPEDPALAPPACHPRLLSFLDDGCLRQCANPG